ncbi:MAG: hypothetical protein ABI921_09090 [Panacibacter sp.]
MVIYRILSFIINFFCALLAVFTIFGFVAVLANPAALLQVFLFASVVLYGWFANRFYNNVVLRNLKMTKKQKDWLQVNAIVAFIFSILGIANGVYVIYNPHLLDDQLQQMPEAIPDPQGLLIKVAVILIIFCSLLFVHVVWTYLLVRKHKENFEA